MTSHTTKPPLGTAPNYRPLFIFDLDGTLALIDHRRPLLDDRDDSKRWSRFYEACDRDEPNTPVIKVLYALKWWADVVIFSGRSDEVRDKTVEWLAKHTCFMAHELDEATLRMRAHDDFTPDDELKAQWLKDMNPTDRRRLVAVFDDRDKVVAMWRTAGVACFQVAPGDF